MTDLQTLLDERDIARALSQFARILDEKRWDDLGEVFDANLTFEYGDGEQAGLSALNAQVRKYLDVCGGTQHLLGSLLIDIDGDRATSRAYVQARHQRRDDTAGPVFDSTGEYRDSWSRTAAGWRIVRRDAVWFLHSGDASILATQAGKLG